MKKISTTKPGLWRRWIITGKWKVKAFNLLENHHSRVVLQQQVVCCLESQVEVMVVFDTALRIPLAPLCAERRAGRSQDCNICKAPSRTTSLAGLGFGVQKATCLIHLVLEGGVHVLYQVAMVLVQKLPV